MTQKVDPSVSELELYKKGEPRGSVPIKTTMKSHIIKTNIPKDKNP